MSGKLRCLAPIIDSRTRVLILGSFPGPESLAMQEYYAHKTNMFWPICLGTLKAAPCPRASKGPLSYKEKVSALKKKRLGLWDVIGSCSREGSSDNNIRNPRFNDILSLLKRHPQIRAVCFNGKKAEAVFRKAFGKRLPGGITLKPLPSTSSANAQLSPEEKRKIWHRVFSNILR